MWVREIRIPPLIRLWVPYLHFYTNFFFSFFLVNIINSSSLGVAFDGPKRTKFSFVWDSSQTPFGEHTALPQTPRFSIR